MKTKKVLALLLAAVMILSLVACGGGQPASKDDASKEQNNATSENAAEHKVYNVANLVNGNLGDKSFFDSAQAGLKELEAAGRITLKTIEMGATDADKPKWEETLNEVSSSGEYDVIVCGTYQMNEFLESAAKANPNQKYIIYDSSIDAPNVCNINYKQNELGYIIGTLAGALTKTQGVENINPENTIGFVGGVDIPVINDFLYGFLLGAQTANPDVKVDTRYVGNFYDTAASKEFALSMINDKKCDVIWGVAGLAGNGAAEAALETKKAWFIGVDSFVYVDFAGEKTRFVEALIAAGQPVLTIRLNDPYDIFREFYRWELAVSVACAILGVNAFDQPNVQDSKTRTVAKVNDFKKNGKLDELGAVWRGEGVEAYFNFENPEMKAAKTVHEFIAAALKLAKAGEDYVAINAYIPRCDETLAQLQAFREKILKTTNCATTLGFGPRFQHSTGQLHKGGANNGVFLQLVADAPRDAEIPGEGMSFATFERAQALGDFEALLAMDRRAIRLNLGKAPLTIL